ncbi:MAG: class II fructose-bisphosphate aldolase [Nitrospinaceae bacterium]|nr:MAG: class II fructose-bisphosphate aldolase [Nitrospinaceae bacterium]
MLFASKDEIATRLRGIASHTNGHVKLENADRFRDELLDTLVENAVLNPEPEIKGFTRYLIKSAALELGAVSASIQGLYEARGRGECGGFTVPALNIRGLPYELSRAIFRTAIKKNAGAFIFEIAKSEIGYTFQPPHELAPVILAAAVKEGFKGPVFIQGDHFQVSAKDYHADRDKELGALKTLIRQAVSAGFYNIDIDTSTLVDLDQPNIVEEQRLNFEVGAELTLVVRDCEPQGITISVGGEIGEVGKENSTEEELRAYMDNFNTTLEKARPGARGISKISIQTGTSHGGVPLPDGSVAEVALDFDTLEKLSRISREDYGLSGAVQHGASTLPPEMFSRFPELETAEIHLATDFQNMVYESRYFPADFKQEIYAHLQTRFANEKKAGQTDEQFIYKTRKKGFGEFKARFWGLPLEMRTAIGHELEGKMDFLFDKLNAGNTRDLVAKTVTPVPVPPNLQVEIEACS